MEAITQVIPVITQVVPVITQVIPSSTFVGVRATCTRPAVCSAFAL